MTAYRENAIFIACCLEKEGVLSATELKGLGTGDKPTLSYIRIIMAGSTRWQGANTL